MDIFRWTSETQTWIKQNCEGLGGTSCAKMQLRCTNVDFLRTFSELQTLFFSERLSEPKEYFGAINERTIRYRFDFWRIFFFEGVDFLRFFLRIDRTTYVFFLELFSELQSMIFVNIFLRSIKAKNVIFLIFFLKD